MPGKRRYEKNEAGLYMCPECDYTAAKSSTLCMHLNKHDKNKQNKCKFCDKVFLQKQILENHLINLSGKGDHPALEKERFECPDVSCDFSSSKKGNCRTHFMRKHLSKETTDLLDETVEGVISCRTCKNTFESEGSFYYHSLGCVSLLPTDRRHPLLEQFA
jgi:hypothetical protein